MKSRFVIASLAFSVMVAGTTRAADTYSADKAHAHVGFEISHMVISKVKGQFKDYTSTLTVEDGKLKSAEAVIEVESIDTGIADRDKHLLAADFFDAENHSSITFKSTHVGDDSVSGKLTIRGITQDVVLPYTLKGPVQDPWGNTKIGLQLGGMINRTDYGLTWSKALETGGLVVGNEVTLDIDLEFSKNKD